MKRKAIWKSCAALLLCALCLCAFLVPAAAAKKQKIALADCRVTLSYKKTTYNGQAKTPDVTVKVSPRQASQIETRVIDGVKYILIPADEGVTVNGISIEV